MDRDAERWTHPNLSEAEAMAIASAIGRPRALWGFRMAEWSQQWLESRYHDGRSACDRVTHRIDAFLDDGPTGARGIAFRVDELELVDRATYRALTEVKDETRFLARYGIDRTRMTHLRTGIQLERNVDHVLSSVGDLAVRDRVEVMMQAGRAMRAERPAIYDGVRSPAYSPELILMGDAYNVACGRRPERFGGDIAAARAAFDADRRATPDLDAALGR